MKEIISFAGQAPTLFITQFKTTEPLRSLNFLPLLDYINFERVSKEFGVFVFKRENVWQVMVAQEDYILNDLKTAGTYEEYKNNILKVEDYLISQGVNLIRTRRFD